MKLNQYDEMEYDKMKYMKAFEILYFINESVNLYKHEHYLHFNSN